MANNDKNYHINSRPRTLRDAESVDFHVNNNDYFGSAATLIRLIRQNLNEEIKKTPRKDWAPIETAFKNLEQDLMILQQDYHIKANIKSAKADDKGKLKSQ